MTNIAEAIQTPLPELFEKIDNLDKVVTQLDRFGKETTHPANKLKIVELAHRTVRSVLVGNGTITAKSLLPSSYQMMRYANGTLWTDANENIQAAGRIRTKPSEIMCAIYQRKLTSLKIRRILWVKLLELI